MKKKGYGLFHGMKKKGSVMGIEMNAWWIIAFVILAISFGGYMILKGKGMGVLDYIKNLFRFRG